MQNLQDLVFTDGYDYRNGSPHLKHVHIYESLLAQVRMAMAGVTDRGLPARLLEIGAGEGHFVEPALAYGFDVTVTETSKHAIETLEERYGYNPSFRAVYDENGSLTQLGAQRYSVILFASVLHHIPDYMSAIEQAIRDHLLPHGTLLTFQDPLWYPSLTKGANLLNRAAYTSWRIGQGNYGRGLRTLSRRLRGILDETDPSDVVEYHVVRKGVDHQSLRALLSQYFEDVSVLTYWSTQSTLWQKVGERVGAKTTFATHARGFVNGGPSVPGNGHTSEIRPRPGSVPRP